MARVTMPRLGESIVEGTLVAWRVRVGDAVARGQILAEVETDKATNEIPAPSGGVVSALYVSEGETVAVGTLLLELAEGAEAAPVPSAVPTTPTEETRLPARTLAPRPTGPGGPARSSPAVRRLAREHGLDVTGVPGTGRGGRVTRDDVLRHLSAAPAAPVPSAAPTPTPSTPPPVSRSEQTPFETRLPVQADLQEGTRLPVPQAALPSTPPAAPPAAGAYRPPAYAALPRDQVVPFSRRRAQIAEHMVYSLGTSAHVAAVAEVDMLRVTQAKAKDAPAASRAGVKLTFMPYVVQAVARALAEYPELNATVVDRSLVLRGERNIGVAVDTEAGLVVPVVRRADELGLLGLARAIEELSARAREGKLTADDISNGTFTLSNPGRDGNLFGISIIRQPEVGILRIGSIVKRPVVREVDGEDVVVVRPIMYAALSYDHRVIDGRTGNGFLARVAALLAGARPQLEQ
ncbi:MAG: 2-oxo acid dehydrogenase subunit E2 [Deltaproteobacteria bacterium]|nr:2-oxo acid dehydrogenase subunit E2 [Deltaproteobacteria bacterium]